MDYTERLRDLALNNASFAEASNPAEPHRSGEQLDAKSMALARLAALVAVGGAEPSYGAQADDAVNAGATAAEMVDVLVGIIPVVGLPCVVDAAPKLAMALGYDLDEAMDQSSG